MINACGTEGENEYVVLRNGDSSFTISSNHIDIRYGTTFPAATTLTDALLYAGNANYVAGLNAKLMPGCDFNFVNGTTSTSLPAEAYFLIQYKAPSDTPNFSAWCGNNIGDVYVIFSDDASWTSSGQFANSTSGSSPRFLRSIIYNVSTDYMYDPPNSTNDGYYSAWAESGGWPVDSGTYNNCTPANLKSLPVSLISAEITYENNQYVLHWTTASEINNAYFTLEYKGQHTSSTKILAQVPGQNKTNQIQKYTFPIPQDCYGGHILLSQTDYNGTTSHISTVKIPYPPINPRIIRKKDELIIYGENDGESRVMCIYDTNGKLLDKKVIPPQQKQLPISIGHIHEKIYFIQLQEGNQTYYIKCVGN